MILVVGLFSRAKYCFVVGSGLALQDSEEEELEDSEGDLNWEVL